RLNRSMHAGPSRGNYAMKDLVVSRRQVLKGAGAFGVLGALGIPTTVFADDSKVRWDIIRVNFATGTLSAGGMASADAVDGSGITLTGSGTFGSGDDELTGGGTWWTCHSPRRQTGTVTHQAPGLVTWPAPRCP